jgi:O-antigen chain-terminating methyltransferase
MDDFDLLNNKIKEKNNNKNTNKINYQNLINTEHEIPFKETTFDYISPEIFYSLTDFNIINNCYQLVLRRSPDLESLKLYQSQLDNGLPALMILFDLSRSQEGHNLGIPLKNFSLARCLYYLAKITKKFGLHIPIWKLLSKLDNYYKNSFKKAFLQSQINNDNYYKRVELLEIKIHQLINHQHEFDQELRLMFDDIKKSVSECQTSQALMRSIYNQNSLRLEPSLINKPSTLATSVQDAIEKYYLVFEDFYRGNSDEIKKGFNDYKNIIIKLPRSNVCALDIGCGRGEWLLWLKDQGIFATGIDSNSAMVQHCLQRELIVEHVDLLNYLSSVPNKSVRLVTSFHVIEHLSFDVLFIMMQEIFRILIPGGIMILETPNPENVLVASHTFYHDFSHRAPITPTSIEFLAKYHGFIDTQILRRNPYPDRDRVIGSDPLTERVNGHFCSFQDFALIAHAPY